jgi:voltage-gated potassium channel
LQSGEHTPAFYAQLLQTAPPLAATLSYLGAAAMVAAALAHTAARCRRPAQHVRGNVLDLALVLGLLVAALLPPSESSPPALALRLIVALVTLVRMLWAIKRLVSRGGVTYLLVLSLTVLGLCGLGFWWLEPTTPTLADGLWLAFTTAATVGYGDVVPTTPASKIFAAFVVLLGFGMLTMATAAIAATWVENEERRIEREILRDLRRQIDSVHRVLAALRAETRSAARLQAEARENARRRSR